MTAHQMKKMKVNYHAKEVSLHEESKNEKEFPTKPSDPAPIRNELLNSTHKFLGVVNTTIQQLKAQGLFDSNVYSPNHSLYLLSWLNVLKPICVHRN